MKKLFKLILILIVATGGYAAYWYNTTTDINDLPELQSGDLIFQTSVNNQTLPIIFATTSLLTHVGIIEATKDGIYVINAMDKVGAVPLEEFISWGAGEHILIKRLPELTKRHQSAVISTAKTYYGKPYDYHFAPGKDKIYCSELPYLVFQKNIGTTQKVGELNMNNPIVERLFEERWVSHPSCQGREMNYEKCWETVLELEIITPTRLANDPKLVTVYDNY